jgi:hypothetical protein
MSPDERERTLREVGEMYDGYGRGHDGMRLPYITRCYRTVVQRQDPEDEAKPDADADADAAPPAEPEDPGTLLIDFR